MNTQLHGFSDASEKGIAAVMYVKGVHPYPTKTISIIDAKSKVAPIKPKIFQMLEITGALMLAKLIDQICTILCIPVSQICI